MWTGTEVTWEETMETRSWDTQSTSPGAHLDWDALTKSSPPLPTPASGNT